MYHAFEHLRRADDWLANAIALANHHLLREEHLLRGYLNTEIAARHHNAISCLDDLINAANMIDCNTIISLNALTYQRLHGFRS